MSFDFNKFQMFQRYTTVLNKKELCTHMYMPWSEEVDQEYMFKIKAEIRDHGHCYMPLMELDGTNTYKHQGQKERDEKINKLEDQTRSSHVETHLLMFNQKVIHVLNIAEYYQDISSIKNEIPKFLKEKVSDQYHWVKVSDLYVLDVDYLGVKEDLNKKLLDFMESEKEQSIFTDHTSHDIEFNLQGNNSTKKWVKAERQLTYDYFMKSCELEESIYPNCWSDISRNAQHLLVQGEILRKESILARNTQKWDGLTEAFSFYRNAIMWELNEVYVFPLVDAITRFESFSKVWGQYTQETSGNHESIKLINDIVLGKENCINDFNDFLYFMDHIKAVTFTLKNQISKKFFSEEFLIVEKFINKQDLKIESFKYKNISHEIKMLKKIETWVHESNKVMIDLTALQVKTCNLKLTHLLSMMNSSSDKNNILFRLIEEKSEHPCSSPNLDEEVNFLSAILEDTDVGTDDAA